MAMFEFDLFPVNEIDLWGPPDRPSLSWFPLTLGWFRVNVGDQTIFEYTTAIRRHWGVDDALADYQIAALARDVLACVGPATERLPPSMECFAREGERVDELRRLSRDANKDDLWYEAWRWLGEREVDASYFVARPLLWFVRIGDEVRVRWDNRDCTLDGISVWTATSGEHTIPLDTFIAECRNFAAGLLAAMEKRIDAVESGAVSARTAVNVASLRQQQETWRTEYEGYFQARDPDVPWDATEAALRELASRFGLPWPTSGSL